MQTPAPTRDRRQDSLRGWAAAILELSRFNERPPRNPCMPAIAAWSRPRLFELATAAWMAMFSVAAPIVAQTPAPFPPRPVVVDPPAAPSESTVRYRVGAKVAATSAPIPALTLYMAVPLECPEQAVATLDEDFSPGVRVEFRQPDSGVRQIVMTFKDLAPGEEAHAFATFEVRTRTSIPPQKTADFKIPKRVDRTLRRYLAPSPLIEATSAKIRAASKEALAATPPDASDWQRVEALYDYAIEHVTYQLGDDKAATQALADGVGDCQAIAAVFVALCRAAKVPARMVWVDGHQYAEFHLETADREGRWFPAESAGTRAFGWMPLARVILQKGDAIRVPERRRETLRYASEYAVMPAQPAAPPAVTFVREVLP
jgi:transglutaminase-like putative cysteine protease